MEQFGPTDSKAAGVLDETQTCTIQQVRWMVLNAICGEGLLLVPKQPVIANVVALPDADQTPGQMAGLAPMSETQSERFAPRIAQLGTRVVVPTLSLGTHIDGHEVHDDTVFPFLPSPDLADPPRPINQVRWA